MLCGAFDIRYAPSSNQLSYCITKPLTHSQFQILWSKLGVLNLPSGWRGDMLEKNTQVTWKPKLAKGTMLEASHQDPDQLLKTLLDG